MKKYLVFLLTLFLFIINSNAQVRFGLKSGLNISSIHGDDAGDLDSKLGFTAGFLLSYQTKSIFILQPEISYTMKGATKKIGPVSFTLAYDYVEIPILFKFAISLDDSPNLKPSVFAGPYIAFKTKAKIIAKANGEIEEGDIKDVTPRDYGFQVGASLGFDLGKYELGYDVRYILGLSSIDESINHFDVKNNVLNINLYFCFANMQKLN
jgi:hypothetical protein